MDRRSSLIFKERKGNKAQGRVHLKTYLGRSLRNKKPPIQAARNTVRAD